jgi:hypothetical protein
VRKPWAVIQEVAQQLAIFFIAVLFSLLIVVENLPHAGHRLIALFAPPPEPQSSLIVAAFIFIPLILLWAGCAYFRKLKYPPASFLIAALLIFLSTDYFLPYPGPVKKTFLMISEGRKISATNLENFSDEPFLTKSDHPIGIAFHYTLSFPAEGKYLVQTHLSPVSHPPAPDEAGIDSSGSALGIPFPPGPDQWIRAPGKEKIEATAYAVPNFIMSDHLNNRFCLFSLAKDLLKDNPGLTKYRVEIRIAGEQNLLDQMALLHFETRNSYDAGAFYESAIKDHMPLCKLP